METIYETPLIDLLSYGDDDTPLYYWLESPSDEDDQYNIAYFN